MSWVNHFPIFNFFVIFLERKNNLTFTILSNALDNILNDNKKLLQSQLTITECSQLHAMWIEILICSHMKNTCAFYLYFKSTDFLRWQSCRKHLVFSSLTGGNAPMVSGTRLIFCFVHMIKVTTFPGGILQSWWISLLIKSEKVLPQLNKDQRTFSSVVHHIYKHCINVWASP